MNQHRLPVRLAAMILLFTAVIPQSHARKSDAGVFDYYVLSLSWSPTYCASRAGGRDNAQCGKKRRFAFVVHGLWPQYKSGWPEYCRTSQRWVLNKHIRRMLDIMPSKRLIIHEWKKHGSCSGLDQKAYFHLTRQLFEKLRIPARYLAPSRPIVITPQGLVHDFLQTNYKLRKKYLSVQCGNRRDRARLSELRICFSRKGEFSACGRNEQRHCQADTLILPPVR